MPIEGQSSKIKGDSGAQSWEDIYLSEESPGWDIGQPSPPFIELSETAPNWLKPGRLINVGCGGGHDAHYFASLGFQVTAVDFAPSAIARLEASYGEEKNLTPFQANIFALPKSFSGTFDYLLEHTCFCAIPREKRSDYVRAAADLVKPGGYLFGLFYRFDEEDHEGPPFVVSMAELEERFSPEFSIVDVSVPKASLPRRRGREKLIVMRRN